MAKASGLLVIALDRRIKTLSCARNLTLTPSPSPKTGEGKRRELEAKTCPNRPGNCYVCHSGCPGFVPQGLKDYDQTSRVFATTPVET